MDTNILNLKCLVIMIAIGIKQNLSNTEANLKKSIACKKACKFTVDIITITTIIIFKHFPI